MKLTLANRNLPILLGCVFIVMTGYGVLLPLLPFFLERLMAGNGNTQNISLHFGILTAIYPITLVIMAPFLGRIADKLGPRPLIVLGLAGFVVMQLMIGVSNSLVMLYTARIIGSVFSSFLLPVINTNISAITTEENRKKALAWSGSAVSAGVIIGPGISGLMANNDLHLNLQFNHFVINRLTVPFLFLAFVGIIMLVITLIFLKPVNRHDPIQKAIKNNGVSPTFKKQWHTIGNLLMLSLFLQLATTLFETVFTLYGKDVRGFSSSFIALGLLVCGAVMAIFQPVIAKWGDKIILKESNQIVFGFILSGISLLLFVFDSNPILIIVLISLFGLGSSFIVPNLLATITIRSPSSLGSSLAWQSSFSGAGQIAGPLGAVAIYSVNKNAPFLFGGLLLMIIGIYQSLRHTQNKIKPCER